MEATDFWQMIIVFILGGIFVFLLVTVIPLITQLKKTARQLEITATTLDRVLQNEFKTLLSRGERVLGEIEAIPPLVKDQLTDISTRAGRVALSGVGNHLVRVFALWLAKKAWRKVRRKDGQRDY
jgi:predicted PurR-regulated permease PerM